LLFGGLASADDGFGFSTCGVAPVVILLTAAAPAGCTPDGAVVGVACLAATTPFPVNSPGLAVAAIAGWP